MKIEEINENVVKKDVIEDIAKIDQLPSNFLIYNFKSIKVRRLLVKEVKALSKIANGDIELLYKIYNNAVYDIDLKELIPADVKFLMWFISRLTNHEFRIEGNFICPNPECESFKENLWQYVGIDLKDVEWGELEKDKFEYNGIKLRPVLFKDLLFLNEHEKELKEKIEDFDYEIALLAIASVDEYDLEKFIESYNKISSLPYSNEFDDIINKIYPDVKPYQAKCRYCNESIDLFFEIDFQKVYL